MSWPRDRHEDLLAFYGPLVLGTNGRPTAAWESAMLTRIELPYRMSLSWDPVRTINRITCHRRVSQSLKRVLQGILQHYGSSDAIEEARLHLFGGCYEFRRVAGSSRLSVHAFGAAIDFDPDRNSLGKAYDPDSGMIPVPVVQIFKDEGWLWGGEFTRPDCMHFQATQ